MARKYNDVEALLLADVRPGMVVISRKTVERVTRTAEQVEIVFDDGSTLTGGPDAGLDVLSSSTADA